MATKLIEATSTVKRTGGVWRVVLATPGSGSKGQKYTRELLEESGPSTFPKGTKSWITHKPIEQRDPRERFGVFRTDAWYDDTLDKAKYPDGALVSELEISPRYRDLAEEFGEDAALSIFADGDISEDGTVTGMYWSEDVSVDWVADQEYPRVLVGGNVTKVFDKFVAQSNSLITDCKDITSVDTAHGVFLVVRWFGPIAQLDAVGKTPVSV